MTLEQEYLHLQREVLERIFDFEMCLGYKPTYVKVNLDAYDLIRSASQAYCRYKSEGIVHEQWLGMKLVCEPKLLSKYFIL